MKLDKKSVLDFFKKSENKASVLIKDKAKAKKTVEEAFSKASANQSSLGGTWQKLQLLYAISRDYLNGSYTEIPKRSIIAIIGGLIYFLSPIDIVPDFIPVVGFVDDVFVLNLVYKQLIKDLEKYKAWRKGQSTLTASFK